MAEGGVGACPQVFVVDTQASYISVPSGKGSRWARVGQKLLLLLVGLTLLGLLVEGFFLYRLYKKTEELSLCKNHPLCQNLSHPQTSRQQGGTILSQVGHKESNDIPTVPPRLDEDQQKPFAQLIGSNTPMGENNLVLWENIDGETVTHHMGYDKGQLLVEKEGYYYLYSKVTLNAEKPCLLIQHKVMKNTSAYDSSIELMRSKSSRCQTSAKASGNGDLWSSFLAGIFHLQSGDKIFVTLENIDNIRPGPTDNLMGAFMIFQGEILQRHRSPTL
ncbi:tumor necrosis factor ligand superfamily member 14-like [Cyclopterus lumpus]|uniref:THD domain-containing protein n=1 Tax=Cyclopterus lumpus TaxID=8103 RepID=A0A8C2WE51_CYCLU|nr:tumor necrosis factor ligand superfamily member 14-like [Cyclopterus lumpus]XP_034393652.1 tumor necrosis factor ligand superfamily member 14-like [Cyclopterus lumpus]XP_034393660.1 tumor necrosis factor ligand superfamily member 14-like [Cyclopterus lumpus]